MLAPAFEAVTSNPGTGGASHNFTSPAITDANYAIISLAYERNSVNINSPTCTFDGVGLDRICWKYIQDTHFWGVAMWRIANPGASKNIVVAWGVSAGFQISTCRTYKNVGLGDPHGAVATASGIGTAVSVSVASAVGHLVLDIANQNTGTFNVGAGQTVRHQIDYEAAYAAGSDEPGAAGSVAMTWTTGNARAWAAAGVSLKPQKAGGQVIWVMSKIQDFFNE
ncbi:unnamed protein product, partial [marine sediment metagenome]